MKNTIVPPTFITNLINTTLESCANECENQLKAANIPRPPLDVMTQFGETMGAVALLMAANLPLILISLDRPSVDSFYAWINAFHAEFAEFKKQKIDPPTSGLN